MEQLTADTTFEDLHTEFNEITKQARIDCILKETERHTYQILGRHNTTEDYVILAEIPSIPALYSALFFYEGVALLAQMTFEKLLKVQTYTESNIRIH